MTPQTVHRPRVGIPWRTSTEEAVNNLAKTSNYQDAVRAAGGDPVLLSLQHLDKLQELLPTLDAFVLPGSPADVNPAAYGEVNRGKSEPPDLPRETTDQAILQHAFGQKKPVLAICYGCQLLNVYLGGTLIQDLREETDTPIAHTRHNIVPQPDADPVHPAILAESSRLAKIAATAEVPVNSSHHQAVERVGKNLHVTAHAPDGTIEAVEWAGDANWIVGVQWHPERMLGDAFSDRLFRDFITAASRSRSAVAHQ
ncbi:MAG: gamma-glutamyl-gamma-aminobutyrate hydrolase family protein [Acidobacteriota bacterium]|nr:gamma-glutamyl-gamma-aminobutyrate hydrolase family protein [Acidobacteriota bacterium]